MYGYMLQAGEGAKKPDSFKALVWASIAQKRGQKEAQDLVNIAKLLLEDKEVAEADNVITICFKSNFSNCPS